MSASTSVLATTASIDDRLKEKYGLSYHVSVAREAEARVGLRGKRVLEIGGSLPRGFVLEELGVEQWMSIEEMTFWNNLPGGDPRAGTPGPQGAGAVGSEAVGSEAVHATPRSRDGVMFSDLSEEVLRRDHAVLFGAVEDLPSAAFGAFDVVFSIAAFEHILNLPIALDRMFAALRPGGCLFSMFSPIWSAHDGHHLPEEIRDASGRAMGFGASPVPPWGHLLMRPPQMMTFLASKTDRETAAQMVFHIYHSRHINRLFTEDYACYFQDSPFRIDTLLGTFEAAATHDVLAHLRRQFPGREHFANNGILVVLNKPA